jgi:hypothetical protein
MKLASFLQFFDQMCDNYFTYLLSPSFQRTDKCHTDLTDLTDIWPLAMDASVCSAKKITRGEKICEICGICVSYAR